MENFDIFYDHLVCFMANWYVLWPIGMFCDHLVYLLAIWYILYVIWYISCHLVSMFPFRCVKSDLLLRLCFRQSQQDELLVPALDLLSRRAHELVSVLNFASRGKL
jgi:hypothetical protein